ncbi:hypothetical protein EYF80_042567 [Liparis tanakae]|uniref:Uncharacterized protein n=1 Tax=Liparis tanakae TaxID=230148 RepID=A0A4Z2G128_9TELE|nr:hypothetical protein EYF80_042567 [Liparis tanakae]
MMWTLGEKTWFCRMTSSRTSPTPAEKISSGTRSSVRRLPAPARCMARIISSTLLRSLISTEHLASSGI